MARLPRLVIPGQSHLIVQRSQAGLPVARDDEDQRALLDALREAAATEKVAVHAWALGERELLLLATPAAEPALGRMMQSLGRRYVSAYNRRHARSGTLWEGRFRCGVVEPGAWRLNALLLVDGAPGATSAGSRSGGARDGLVVDPAEFWALGNTPFEREAAYRGLLAQGLPAAQSQALRRAARGGWACGSPAYLAELGAELDRPLKPRGPGRPRRG